MESTTGSALLSYLLRRSRTLLLFAATASVGSGACSVLLISQINAALTTDDAMSTVFAVTAIAAMLCHMVSGIAFARLSQQVHAAVRRYVSSAAIAADFRRLEQVGAARLQSALTEHGVRVGDLFLSLPLILTNIVVVAGCMVYMAVLSLQVFAAAVVFIALGCLSYYVALLRSLEHLDAASREQDALFGHFEAMTSGAKELRLNEGKRVLFTAALDDTIAAVQRRRTHGLSIFVVSGSWGNFLIFAFIGVVLFGLVGTVGERAHVITGFALVFVYMVTPLQSLLSNIPYVNLARTSAARIDEVVAALGACPETVVAPRAVSFRSIALRSVEYRYYLEQTDGFSKLGPIDLTFRPGEVTFLVGGNGSGKTTLAKVLVGLYAQESGDVVVDDCLVGDADRGWYRQHFTAVFADYHLFESLLERDLATVDERANVLLRHLHLHHKVKVNDGAFSTLALSQGQRKRLALVVALLEDRPFLVFDEWPADQDPFFKDIFYCELLPELRAQGKAVLVISHDERYFRLADRLVHIENGQLISVGAFEEDAIERFRTGVAKQLDRSHLAKGPLIMDS